MPSLLLTVLSDDGTVTQRCSKPLFDSNEVAIRVFPGTLNVRLVHVAGDSEGRYVIAEGDLLDMLNRGGQSVNKGQLAARLRIIADRLESEV